MNHGTEPAPPNQAPAVHGRTGTSTFIVMTDRVIWGKDRGPENGFVANVPGDPEGQGWERGRLK